MRSPRPARPAGWFILLIAATGAASAGCAAEPTTRPAPGYQLPAEVATLDDDRIREASGIVASQANPGLFYIHNDSGDPPRVFLVDRDGRTRCTVRLRGIRAVDFEDIALGPGKRGGPWDVYVADIGDNLRKRNEIAVYRWRDVPLAGRDEPTRTVRPRVIRLRYPDAAHDAEACVVDPVTGDGFILTKHYDGQTRVYRWPADAPDGGLTTLEHVLTVTLPPALGPSRVVTAADITADGRRLAVRAYLHGWEWRAPVGEHIGVAKLLRQSPARLELAPEPQAEALCYSADGQRLLTVSEGRHPVLYEVGPPDAATAP